MMCMFALISNCIKRADRVLDNSWIASSGSEKVYIGGGGCSADFDKEGNASQQENAGAVEETAAALVKKRKKKHLVNGVCLSSSNDGEHGSDQPVDC